MINYLKAAALFTALILTGFDPVELVSGVAEVSAKHHQGLATASHVTAAQPAQPLTF